MDAKPKIVTTELFSSRSVSVFVQIFGKNRAWRWSNNSFIISFVCINNSIDVLSMFEVYLFTLLGQLNACTFVYEWQALLHLLFLFMIIFHFHENKNNSIQLHIHMAVPKTHFECIQTTNGFLIFRTSKSASSIEMHAKEQIQPPHIFLCQLTNKSHLNFTTHAPSQNKTFSFR